MSVKYNRFAQRNSLGLVLVIWLYCQSLPYGVMADEFTGEQLTFFEQRVRPLLVEHCYECHSGKSKTVQGGLRLDSRAGLLKGGDSGTAVDLQEHAASLLMQSVRYESFEMPPRGKLAAADIETFAQWVAMGAPWPAEAEPGASEAPAFDLQSRKQAHWAWQPIDSPALPQVMQQAWPRNEVDRFLLQRLEQAGVHPAEDASPHELIRRLSFDLVGLPPSPERLRAFEQAPSPQAYERMIDEFLASPEFGERWGRHWLDLVRYAESRGHEFDTDAINAFQYRDYVIRAFNADVPYDQWIREHIAGDLLSTPRLDPATGFNESILGTGFWFLGEWVHSPVDIRKDESDRFDNMIDVMSKTFLAATVSCARCHDHKFDAISTADYYALCGFLQSSDYRQVAFESLQQHQQLATDLQSLDADYRKQVEAILGPFTRSPALDRPPVDSVVIDYTRTTAAEWLQDGFLFGPSPCVAGTAIPIQHAGQPMVDWVRQSAAISDSFWAAAKATHDPAAQNVDKLHTLPRSGRTLRTATFTLEDGRIHCRVQGSGQVVACVDSHRFVAGPLHQETIRSISSNDTWVELRLDRYVGHRLHLEFTPNEQASLAVSFVLQGATADDLRKIEEYQRDEEKAVAAHAAQIQQRLQDDPALQSRVAALGEEWLRERLALQSRIRPSSQTAMAMLDGSGEDDRILIRGNSSNPGPTVPRRFLEAIAGSQPLSIARGSGRLELANQIADLNNPLTDRVIVNRVWHWLFGRGIVPTPDDFGVLGQPPTHPELLDYLADRFQRDGRSIKQLVRYLVTSRAYRMSSRYRDASLEADPKNLLWHYRPPKRLEGEAIRDSLLQLAGTVNRRMGGPAVPIHLNDFMDGRGRPKTNGPLDGSQRRSIYIAVRRNFLSPFMLAFDSPTPFSTMGRRNVSNVPAQALILMNDPFVWEQCQRWGQMLASDRRPHLHTDLNDQIESVYLAAFARRPTPEEHSLAKGFIQHQVQARGIQAANAEIWAEFVHALINTKEFIFIR